MNRRGFLKAILAAGIAPAIVKAENIMRIQPQKIITPESVFSGPVYVRPQSAFVEDAFNMHVKGLEIKYAPNENYVTKDELREYLMRLSPSQILGGAYKL